MARDVLAIGTSAGGVEALRFLARSLPAEFPAAVVITIHLSSEFRSNLDDILERSGPLPASFARDGEPLRKSHIYLAPPERHLIVEGAHLRLGTGPRENFARPAIDPMLRSVALCCGERAIGVVLTGTLSDGASGLHDLKTCGGITVVQDPADAAYSEMPAAAMKRSVPDHVALLDDMPALLGKLVREAPGEPTAASERIRYEVEVARSGRGAMEKMDRIGRRSVMACPDCNGVLWEIDDGDLVRYRCHIGHAYTSEIMNVALDECLRRALATALRVLEERVTLSKKLEEDARRRGSGMAQSWARRAKELKQEEEKIRRAILRIDQVAARLVKGNGGEFPSSIESDP